MTTHTMDATPEQIAALERGATMLWLGEIEGDWDHVQESEYPGEFEAWKDGERHRNIDCPYDFGDVLALREVHALCVVTVRVEITEVRAMRPKTELTADTMHQSLGTLSVNAVPLAWFHDLMESQSINPNDWCWVATVIGGDGCLEKS